MGEEFYIDATNGFLVERVQTTTVEFPT